MKKFIIVVCAVVCLYIIGDYCYYHLGIYIDLKEEEVTTFTRTEGDGFLILKDGVWEPLEIRGVNLGSGEPGQWSTDFHIDEETYLRWFAEIQEMGANTIRVYTVQDENFYNAFYEYNRDNPDPLWMFQGVWVNDYVQNSRHDAYFSEFYDAFLTHSKIAVDVIHGARKINMGTMPSAGSGTYNNDVSPWVIGFILG
ncbi:MAG: hypothetical protein J6E42_08485, partial [Firmicutes bacterium]|nr:hypothetical protein [Bacillota bacterium]